MAISTIQQSAAKTVVDGTAYIRGSFFADSSMSNIQAAIIAFVASITTNNLHVHFDVRINKAGNHRFIGFIYPDKTYGSGLLYSYGTPMLWKRANNNDTFYEFSLTKMQN